LVVFKRALWREAQLTGRSKERHALLFLQIRQAKLDTMSGDSTLQSLVTQEFVKFGAGLHSIEKSFLRSSRSEILKDVQGGGSVKELP